MGVVVAVFLALLLLPAAMVGVAAWAWWSRLTRRSAFIVSGLIALYVFAKLLVTRSLGGIGMSKGVDQPVLYLGLFPLDPLTAYVATLVPIYLAGSVGILLLLRHAFSRG